MAKKKNAPAARTSISKDIHDLKTLNSDLVNEVAELRKQIEHLRSRLDSLTADCDILQIMEATYEAESATAELNAMEMPLLALRREQDAVERDLELVIEGSDITQYSEKAKHEKIRNKNWIFHPIAITAIFFVSTAVVSFYKSSKLGVSNSGHGSGSS
ncbi:hypothetical protein M5K25_013372 [Dendrobium thyrsiflorum]|uniref:Uncharacterized protein n=1 Tax=Dendrobium thyrsiflorum TaxID=117978 RepID=A0ABD0UTV0_DENTH